jgi:hypothetical protein
VNRYPVSGTAGQVAAASARLLFEGLLMLPYSTAMGALRRHMDLLG